MLSNVQGRRYTVQTRHDDIHKDHIKLVAANLADSGIGIGAIGLCNATLDW